MAPHVVQYQARGHCLHTQGAVHTNEVAFSENEVSETRGRRASQGSNHSNAQKNVLTPDNEDRALSFTMSTKTSVCICKSHRAFGLRNVCAPIQVSLRLGAEPRSIDCPTNNIIAFKKSQLRTEVRVGL